MEGMCQGDSCGEMSARRACSFSGGVFSGHAPLTVETWRGGARNGAGEEGRRLSFADDLLGEVRSREDGAEVVVVQGEEEVFECEGELLSMAERQVEVVSRVLTDTCPRKQRESIGCERVGLRGSQEGRRILIGSQNEGVMEGSGGEDKVIGNEIRVGSAKVVSPATEKGTSESKSARANEEKDDAIEGNERARSGGESLEKVDLWDRAGFTGLDTDKLRCDRAQAHKEMKRWTQSGIDWARCKTGVEGDGKQTTESDDESRESTEPPSPRGAQKRGWEAEGVFYRTIQVEIAGGAFRWASP